MSLQIGQQLGSYEIMSLIGKGGMGEVYRARDTKLKREVAIKVLPDEFCDDASRVSRFQREAEVLASLNHPNIAGIYGVEQAMSTRLSRLEIVEGETLAERIARGPVPLDEALDIMRGIGEALEAAHEKGIIHRDLKPANMKVTADGKVKVLDFGLARAGTSAVASSDESPTISMAATQAGVILGTAAYMSPEQARGKAVTRATDIFAFGAVLYESLTAKQAFQGEDAGDILAAVVKTEPDWSLLPHSTPPGIRTMLQRCMRKDPRQRLRDATGIRIEIEEALANPYTAHSRGRSGAGFATWDSAADWHTCRRGVVDSRSGPGMDIQAGAACSFPKSFTRADRVAVRRPPERPERQRRTVGRWNAAGVHRH